MLDKYSTTASTTGMRRAQAEKTQDELTTKLSTQQWLTDLASLLANARDRFTDVSWYTETGGQIFAHKAILYARSGGQFQSKYLGARIPMPTANGSLSTISLPSQLSHRSTTPTSMGSHLEVASPFPRATSPASMSLLSVASTLRAPMNLDGTDPAIFQSMLEFLYTANGMVDIFAFLFDDPNLANSSKEERVEKLRQDLLYMWRSKLYADAEIRISESPGNTSDSLHQQNGVQDAVFATHRAILCSRSPYFRSILLNRYSDSDNRIFTLPSPPFTPASLHFCLGWLYCGTLDFSNRTFDLSTAFEIWRSAAYLNLDLLKTEVERKIESMIHNFKDTCRVCTKRAGRVFEFASASDVSAPRIYEGAKGILTNPKVFGDSWGREVGHLDSKLRDSIGNSVLNATNPNTFVDIIKGCATLRQRIQFDKSPSADNIRTLYDMLEKKAKQILIKDFKKISDSQYFRSLCDGVGFSSDLLERILLLLVETLTDENAALCYQVLIGNVLLREDGISMDARALVEDAKDGILKYLKRRWVNVRQYNAFASLENWALKEISDELEVPVSDLLDNTTKVVLPSTKVNSKVKRQGDDTDSLKSLRASVLNRNAARTTSQTGSIRPVTTPAKPRPSRATSTTSSRLSIASTSTVSSSVKKLRAENAAIRKEIEADRKSVASSIKTSPAKPSRSPPNPSQLPSEPPTQKVVRRAPSQTSVSSKFSTTRSISTAKAGSSIITNPKSVKSSASLTSPPVTVKPPPKAPSVTSVRPRRVSAVSIKSFATTSTASPGHLKDAHKAKSINGGSLTRTSQKAPSIISTRSTRSINDTQKSTSTSTTPKRTLKVTPSESIASQTGSPSNKPRPPTKPKKISKPKVNGSALNVGIPAIVTLKTKEHRIHKIKAVVRYIGAVDFDKGSWVGVEVDARLIGKEISHLQWNNGIVNGVRYFELGTEPLPSSNRATSPLPTGFASANSSAISLQSTTKSETPTVPTKGLFVRSSSVLYVL